MTDLFDSKKQKLLQKFVNKIETVTGLVLEDVVVISKDLLLILVEGNLKTRGRTDGKSGIGDHRLIFSIC